MWWGNQLQLSMITITCSLLEQIKVKQEVDEYLRERMKLKEKGKIVEFKKDIDGVIKFQDRICVPNDSEIKRLILDEAHKSKLSIHPGATKMYQDLKRMYWWPKMKKEITCYVATCLVSQKAKIEHKKPAGKLQPLDIP